MAALVSPLAAAQEAEGYPLVFQTRLGEITCQLVETPEGEAELHYCVFASGEPVPATTIRDLRLAGAHWRPKISNPFF